MLMWRAHRREDERERMGATQVDRRHHPCRARKDAPSGIGNAARTLSTLPDQEPQYAALVFDDTLDQALHEHVRDLVAEVHNVADQLVQSLVVELEHRTDPSLAGGELDVDVGVDDVTLPGGADEASGHQLLHEQHAPVGRAGAHELTLAVALHRRQHLKEVEARRVYVPLPGA